MTSDIVSFVFNILLSLIFFLIKLVLLPIDFLLREYLPQVSSAFTSLGEFLNMISTGLGWALSAAAIPSASVILIATYMIFRLTWPIVLSLSLKLILKWYDNLKP